MQVQDFLQERLTENKKTKAPFLDLGLCGLTELPKELAGYTWLEDINLGTVYWSDAGQKFLESQNDGPLNNLEKEDFSVLKPCPDCGDSPSATATCGIWKPSGSCRNCAR